MKKIIAILLLVVMSITMMVGCSAKETEKSDNELTKVVISEFRHLGWLPVYVAYQNGYFQKEGLAPEFALYKDGPIAFQGMHGGDSQFCLLSQEPVLKAEEEGLDSSIIYTVLDTRLYGFVGSKDVKSVKDLKGQAIFAGMPGSAPYSFVSAILKEGGLDPQKDVTFVNLDYSASMTALSQGQIKASYINVDNRTEIKNMDVNILVDTSSPTDAAKYLKTDVFTGEIITTTSKFAAENPETVQGFVNAVHKGTKWINEHNSEEVAKLVAPLFQGMEEDVLAIKIEIIKDAFTKTGYISEESQAAVDNFAIKNGVINTPIPYNKIIDMQFVNAIK
ncbi:ABC transporter substrate-binding protein [Marinisporobacter balticus]|uniref:NitT/TauT family transport system substrate-binding protein n=1 Tax=Marinisporobacter balticus TaxID=2018667 RepID=A0A4R2KLA0_9FIRM|nr:ABC transporter substrate-binding protein [Marinisporobacter balticus]TCO74443.1 NitT/TauT family transport system substrate-binding protein [Marinisporobacter balticus]